MTSMFDYDDSINSTFNAKTAGKNLVTAKHEVLDKTGEFLFLAHSDREFALRCQMVEADIESAAVRKMANVSDSKAKLVRALHEEWKIRHASCDMCKTGGRLVTATPAGTSYDPFSGPDSIGTDTTRGVREIDSANPRADSASLRGTMVNWMRSKLRTLRETIDTPGESGKTLRDTGGGRFYYHDKTYIDPDGNKTSHPTLFFAGGRPGEALPLTAKIDAKGDSFLGYLQNGNLRNYADFHEPCNGQHVHGVELATVARDATSTMRRVLGLPAGKRAFKLQFDRTKGYQAPLEACMNDLRPMSDKDNAALFAEMSKDPNWVYNPQHPQHKEMMDKIGTFVKDASTPDGQISVVTGLPHMFCGQAFESTTSNKFAKPIRMLFSRRGRSKNDGVRDRDVTCKHDGELSQRQAVLLRGETPEADEMFKPAVEGESGGLRENASGVAENLPDHMHLVTTTTSPYATGGKNGTDASYVGGAPQGDPYRGQRVTQSAILAPHEAKPILGEDGKPEEADLGNPMGVLNRQIELEAKHGYSTRSTRSEDRDIKGKPSIDFGLEDEDETPLIHD